MIDDALAVLDHIAARVTASAMTGLGCGAAFATYKGFPIFKTSTSAALSCALISTACFGMERLAYGALGKSSILMDEKSIPLNAGGSETTSSMIQPPIPNPRLLYGSHALGGLAGGGVVGFLFHGKPWAGAFLLVPIMLGIGRLEISLDEMIDNALAVAEHVATRVTASTTTGLFCGAVYASVKGSPFLTTSMMAALSCALTSMTCFGMERIAYGIISAILTRIKSKSMEPKNAEDGETSSLGETDEDSETDDEFDCETALPIAEPTITNPRLLYGTHALGGLAGGSTFGFLFYAKPWFGALLVVPIMLCIGRIEVTLDEYRAKQLQQSVEAERERARTRMYM
ncbi:hypothetical protein ACHAXR_008360 [Thalassiosira sp. AJA248-18]